MNATERYQRAATRLLVALIAWFLVAASGSWLLAALALALTVAATADVYHGRRGARRE